MGSLMSPREQSSAAEVRAPLKMSEVCEADLPSISDLAKRSDLLLEDLTEQNFPAMLKWLYFDPPSGAHFELMASQGGSALAHYGAVPFAFRFNGIDVTAGLASNLVVDKEARSGSLFFSLQNYFFREYPKKNFGFMYGLITRDGVLEPHLRMGWKKVGEVPVYARPVNLPRVAQAALENPLVSALAKWPLRVAQKVWNMPWRRGRGVNVERAVKFDESIEPLLEAVSAPFHAVARRSAVILNWRFAGLEMRGYQIFIARKAGRPVGYLVLRRMKMKGLDALALVDFAFDPKDLRAGRAVLAACRQEAVRQGVDVIATTLNPHSPFLPFLRRAGFFKTPETFKLVVHTPKGSPLAFDSELFANWHLTWFDHDYV